MQLSLEQIRLLADLERKMDRGEQPFVLNHGHRYAFCAEVLSHLGIESGQTVGDSLLLAIMEANLLNLKRKMEHSEGTT